MEGSVSFGKLGGDVAAFQIVFEKLYGPLVLFAKRYVDDLQAAEDVVQDSFVHLWKGRGAIDAEKSVKSLLYTAVRNRCLNLLRDEKLRRAHYQKFGESIEGDTFFENVLIEEETLSLITMALKDAGEQTRNVFKMSLDGYKNAEIAEALNISERTVKYHKTQARLLLGNVLKKTFFVLLSSSMLSLSVVVFFLRSIYWYLFLLMCK
ncbi:MAG: RNA polymerase sigma-70 factor [Breznakibacter sp.]